MTRNPPQILPLKIFQAMREYTLQLAGNLLHKQLCRDRSCVDAGSFCSWEGNTSLRSPVLHSSQKRSTDSQTKTEGKDHQNSNVQFWILLMHHTENYPGWGFWTAESVPASRQPPCLPIYPQRRHPDQQWRQKSQRMQNIHLDRLILQFDKYIPVQEQPPVSLQ